MNAERLFRSGKNQRAVDLCEAIFRFDKAHAPANDLMARIYLNIQAYKLALQHAETAVDKQPNKPEFLYTKIEALMKLERQFNAATTARDLVQLAPDWAEAWLLYAKVLILQAKVYEALSALNIGLGIAPDCPDLVSASAKLLLDVGQVAPAKEILEKLLKQHPGDAMANLHMADIMHRENETDAALKKLKSLRDKHPENIEIKMFYADLLRQKGARAEAVREYEQVLRQEPTQVKALFGVGLSLVDLNQQKDAMKWLDKAMVENDQLPELWAAKSMANSGMKNTNQAIECNKRALELNPRYSDGYNNMGLLMMDLGKPDEARKNYYRSLEYNPHYKEALFNIGLLDLLQGDFHDGWEGYAMRWEASSLKGFKPVYAAEEWDGVTDISDKTLLLYTEQGFGDCLQFIRYIPLIRDKVGKIVIHCQPELLKIFETVEGIDLTIPKEVDTLPADVGKNLPVEIDYQQALLTLPQLLRTRMDNIPVNVPYIRSHPDFVQELPNKDSDKFKVVVTWSANLANVKLIKRNMPFANLERLLKIEGTQFYNMQLGKPLDEAKQAIDNGRIIDLSPQMKNFADTAALLEQVDLVVSVDTGLVHLCGAMDIPVWVMMPFSADWRWLSGMEDNIWYPSLRIMRQSKPHSWGEVLDWVERDLKEKVTEFHANK